MLTSSSSSLDCDLSPPEGPIRPAILKLGNCLLLPALADPTLRAIEGKVVLLRLSLSAPFLDAGVRLDETRAVSKVSLKMIRSIDEVISNCRGLLLGGEIVRSPRIGWTIQFWAGRYLNEQALRRWACTVTEETNMSAKNQERRTSACPVRGLYGPHRLGCGGLVRTSRRGPLTWLQT